MSQRQSRIMEFRNQRQKTSIQYFHQLIPEKTTKSKLKKKLVSIDKYAQIYEVYLKLLLGTDMELTNYRNYCSLHNITTLESDVDNFGLPEAIISLPNPDFIPDEYESPLKQLEIFEQIVKSLYIDEKSVHDKIFVKAIENVFTHLADRKIYSLFELKTRGLDSNHQQKRNTLNLLGTAQQLLNKSPDKSPRSLVLCDAINKSDYPVYYREELISKMVRKFKKYLTDNIRKEQTSQYNITDYLQTDIMKLVYVQKKAFGQGEYLKKLQGKWVRTKNETSDLLTLVRNSLIIQLSRKGFHIKSFVSKNGESIILQLYMPEKMLEIAAENFQLNKKLSFSLTDLLSLEPVDKSFRPLRLNGRLWKHEEYSNSPYLEYLRPLIIEQIQQINFKRLATEIGQSGINVQLFEYGKNDLHGDQEGPSEDEWTAYYKYLVHLNKQIQVQREQYRIDNDIALCITKDKPVEELYLVRKFQKKGKKNLRNSILYSYNELTKQDLDAINEIKKQIDSLQQETESLKLLSKIPKLKKIKLVKQQQLAHNYQQIFKEALKVANCSYFYLKNIWDRIGQQPVELHASFSINTYRKRISQKAKQQLRWCRYIKNEQNQMTLFPPHERLKLAYSVIASTLNFNNLKGLLLANQIFCLHDQFELFGHCQSIQKAVSKESSYQKKKLFDIQSEWKLNPMYPWISPTEKICYYFGEKIGLYFEHSAYFIKYAIPMAALGVLFSVILFAIGDFNNPIFINIMVVSSFLIIHWNSFITEFWNQKQLSYNLKFGQQMEIKENLIRSNFKGQRARSIETDDLNAIEINQIQYLTRLFLSLLIVLLLIGIYFGIIIGLYYLNLYLKEYLGREEDSFYFEIVVTAALNYVIQLLIDQFYEKVCILVTDFQNFKTQQEYETSYIVKKYILYSFQYVVPLLFISFLNKQLGLYCSFENCQHHVQYYFGTTTMMIFLYQVVKFLKLFFYNKEKFDIKKYQQTEEDLNNFIEDQAARQPFSQSMELYGIQDEYMQFFVFLTLINIFGYIFPFSITLLWVWTIIQVQIEKYKLLFLFQRPWPKCEGSLGIWNDFSQIVNYISLLCNTGMITIYYNNKLESDLIVFFVALTLFNFMMKFAIYSMFGDVPLILEQIIKRSKYILRCNVNVKGTSRSSKKQEKWEIQRCPLYKVFGSEYESRVGVFETISSDDEISDHYVHNEKKKKNKQISKNEKKKDNNSNRVNKKSFENSFEMERDQKNMTFKISNENDRNNDILGQIDQSPNYEMTYLKNDKKSKGTDLEIKKDKQNDNNEIIKTQKQPKISLSEIQQLLKNYHEISKLDYNFLNEYFSNRANSLEYQINAKGEKNQKKIRTYVYKFFLHLSLLTKYNIIWTDYRMTVSHFYLPRKQLLLHNLDFPKYRILKKSYDSCNEYYQDEAMLKYRKQFQKFGNTLTADEVQEYNELLNKYHNYIEKKSWLKCRKIVVLRFKGIFFRGFRKQTTRKSSIKYVYEYYEAIKRLADTQFESEIHKQFNSLVSYQSLNSYNLDMFIELFNELKYEPKQIYYIPSTTRRVNQKIYHTQFLKSAFYRNVIDKSKDTYIFEQQQLKVEEFVQQYYLDEVNQVPTIKLMKHLHDILWIVKLEDGQEYLMQFFQVKHGQQLNFQKYHNDDLGIYLGESTNYIRLPNLVDQIDDFYVKGYCISLYKCKNCKSLWQVLQFRNKYSIHYTADEIKKFLFANLVLLTRRFVNNISIQNYILIENEYMILNSISQCNPVHSLVQVIVEMILLRPIDDLIATLQVLDHPYKYFLQDIIYEDKSPKQILDRMMDQTKFSEIDFQVAPISRDITYFDYMENMKHQINFHMRMKQFSKSLLLIKETEEFIRINHFQTTEELLPYFVNQFSKNLSSYILRSNDIKRILDILLVYHFKMCVFFGLRKEFEKDAQLLIDGLKRCVAQLRVMFRQLSLNVKLENLSEIEQCIILKKKINSNLQKQSSISSFERLNLLNTLRQNQDYILVIVQYQTQLQRYLNQFQAIAAINSYFNKNFILAIIQLNDVIMNQEQLVMREPAPIILDVPLDHSVGLINIDQQSPKDEEQLYQETQETSTNNLVNGDRLYCSQLLFYKFLYLINLFDSNNETFSFYYNEFQEMSQVNQFLYKFYIVQLKPLMNETLTLSELEQDKQCEVGKYHYINQDKWMEIKQHQQIKLQNSLDHGFLWRQIMIFSDLYPSLENRQIIKSLINVVVPQTAPICSLIFQIKLIQQLLHMDNYSTVSHSLSFSNQDTQTIKQINEFCYIKLLQDYHFKIAISKDSWFFHFCLDEIQMFYYLSICFAFSPKHIENVGKLEPEIVSYACNQIKKFQAKPRFYAQILKCTQINNRLADTFLFDSNLPVFQQYQIFGQFFNCTIKSKQTLKHSYQKMKDSINDGFQPSMLVLMIIHSYLACQQTELVDLILQFSQKLLNSQAYIFHHFHDGFEQDLQLIECLYQNNNNLIPLPQRNLYKYSSELAYFEDYKFNVQYLLFNLVMNQDYYYIQEILQETIEQLKSKPDLIRFIHLFQSFQEVVKAIVGQIEVKKQFNFKIFDYREGTLIYAFLCHFQCKYYMNFIDYDIALKFSVKVLSYINASLSQEGVNISCKNNTLFKEYYVNQTLQMLNITAYDKIFEEMQDSDYVHLFNQDFINDAILNHITILINLGENLPNMTLLFQIQLMLENKVHVSNLQCIYASYFNYFLNEENNDLLLEQLKSDQGKKLSEVKEMITTYEQKQQAYYLLKLNILSEVTMIDQKLKILDFQLNILLSVHGGLNKKMINNWALQCSQRAIDGYQKLMPSTKQLEHPYISMMHLLQCESYQFLGLLINSQKMIDKAEVSLKAWFDDNRHPLKGLFFYYQGNHNRWLYKQYLRCTEEIIELKEFDAIEIKIIVQGLMNQENQIHKTFDYFHQNVIKKISSHLNNFVLSQIGKHTKLKIGSKYKKSDAKEILDDIIYISSIRELNGISQYLDALAIFNHFETEHLCIDKIKSIITCEE